MLSSKLATFNLKPKEIQYLNAFLFCLDENNKVEIRFKHGFRYVRVN